MANVMLAESWNGESDVCGWFMSEKLDGLRALWTDGRFVSRNGITLPAPEWFKARMPHGETLDGELWCGRGQFQQCVSIVKNTRRGDDWRYVQFMVFDAPRAAGGWEARMARACAALGASAVARAVGAIPCESAAHVREELRAVESKGGEGLMLRRPGSAYEPRRSRALLKVKSFRDEEAEVVGHEPGKGKHAGRLGALLCRTPDGRRFAVGTGLSDAQRAAPPASGSVVTYKYFELTADRIPRFPTFVGERTDLNWGEYCASYRAPGHKAPGALKRACSLMYTEKCAVAEAPDHDMAVAGASDPEAEARPFKRATRPEAPAA